MEEPPLLLAVDRIVSGVEVQDDPLRRLPMGLHEQIEEHPVDGLLVHCDLLVAIVRSGLAASQLEAVQGALAGQRLAAIGTAQALRTGRIGLADQGRQKRIAPQIVVVVEILVAQSQTVDPLADEIEDGVLDQISVAVIDKAVGELPQDARPLLDLSKQQAPSVGTEVPPSKLAITARRK